MSAALVNYGHYTAMLVERGRVRGLARHLERLDRDAWVVFGRGLPEEDVRAAIRAAIGDERVAAKVTVVAPDFNPRDPGTPEELSVVVETFPPPEESATLAVRTAGYRRDLPQVKHVGTFGIFYQRRLARMAGFDDALFAPDDEVSEGATWNICFRDDAGAIVWPSAPALPGVSAALIQNGLTRLGHKHETRPVTLDDLAGFRSAFATNALAPVRPITRIDDVEYAVDDETASILRRAHDLVPEERV
ncbi:aminotransferase class IV [Actinokineospora sp. UTMC 2448]|uniref:aminotransferase class IV n=1 Tax=Actinokineospora sp. UTMC 2448 TaxID=2268449 RepID=UPI0021642E6D|nr:aminotransferase class IV [Actinokineospora sp. UTMC 2448]UVS80862.1 4-amino-4-deoxychorismate lyase [Actinokineospora sp. UTMC 2448]